MDELTRILWEYACKYRLESCYDRNMQEERQENEEAADFSRKKLEELCSSQALGQMEDLCYCMEVIHSVDEEAAFTCGLRLGLSLGR